MLILNGKLRERKGKLLKRRWKKGKVYDIWLAEDLRREYHSDFVNYERSSNN